MRVQVPRRRPCYTGAHVAAVLRRLQRLSPSCQYFACSATVRDASGHASSLLPPSSRRLVVIDDDASPRGPKQVVVWNPPLKKEKKIKRKKIEAETDEYDLGADSASRGAAAPSRHRRDSCPSDEVVGGLFFEFEAIRTEASDRDAPRRRIGLLTPTS